MAKRIVEWDDFTGGYYVGPSATQQPRNTYQGDNVTVAMDDATLIPLYPVLPLTLSGTTVTSGLISTSFQGLGQPAALNGLTCFIMKGSSAVYLYVINTSSVVTRTALTLAGTVNNFIVSRPVMVQTQGTATTDVYIAGDYRRIIKFTLYSDGTVTPAGQVNITNNAMTATGDGYMYGLAIWGARMVGWSLTANLYFSEAADFTTWASVNFIVVGYADDYITTVVPRNYDLIVGKPSGWYVVTGVLNYSAAVRQINNGLGVISGDSVSEWNNQVAFSTDTGTIGFPVNLYTVNGARVQPFVFQRFSGNVQNISMSKGPLGVLQLAYAEDNDASISGFLWFLNQQNRWSKAKITTCTAAVTGDTVYFWPVGVAQSRSAAWTAPTITLLEVNMTTKKIGLQYMAIPSFEPGKNADATPATATAKLVDYMSQVPISVTDVLVEVEVAQLYDGYNYTGSGQVSAQINMKYPLGDLALSVGDVSSTNLTYTTSISTIPGTGTRFLGRMYRFKPDNAGHGFGFEVAVTFSGCKVRRIIAVVETHE